MDIIFEDAYIKYIPQSDSYRILTFEDDDEPGYPAGAHIFDLTRAQLDERLWEIRRGERDTFMHGIVLAYPESEHVPYSDSSTIGMLQQQADAGEWRDMDEFVAQALDALRSENGPTFA